MSALFRFRILATCFAVALACLPAYAVDVNARIRGVVADASGAAIPGATVTATNEATGVKQVQTTQASGTYIFQQLPVGTYTITIAAPGFKTFVAKGIILTIDQEYVESAKLSIGQAVETVQVLADPVQVNTTDMQLSNIVEGLQLTELPLLGRGFTALEQLEPGIQASSDRFGSYSAQGSQTQQSSYLINGADTNEFALNTVTFSPNPDAIDQFNLVTGPLNAEYDRNSGGIVSVSIKSGTNKFHGDVFEFYRDTFLNTGNYFSYVPATPTKAAYKNVTPYHQNIFGGTLGGPIFKDKLFFFGAYQGTRQRVPGSGGTTTVFSPAQLGGDFSADVAGSALGYKFSATNTIPGTLTNLGPGCPAGGTWAACIASNGGKFPTTAFNPVAAAITKQYVPAANQGTNSYVFNSVSTTSVNQYLGRLDFSPNTKNQIYAIGIYQKAPTTATIPFSGASLPGFGEIDTSTLNQYTGDWVSTISGSLVNDLAVHFTRFNYQAVFPQSTALPSTYGFAINPQLPSAATLPVINTGYFSLGFSSNGPQPRIDTTYQADETVSKSLGHHQLKFGYDGRKYTISNPFYSSNSGSYGFSSGGAFSSGDPGLDFLLGNSSSYAQGSGAQISAYAYLTYLFAQDTWKVSDNLTLSYGLGYQIDTPLHNRQYGGLAIICFDPGVKSTVFNTAPTGINYPGDPGCTDSAYAHTRYKDFGPRFGFAYSPDLGMLSGGNSHKLSIRGGVGIYYNRTEEETSLNNLADAPFGVNSGGAADYGAQAPAFINPYQDIDTGTVYKNKFPYTFPKAGQTIDYSIYEPLSISTYDKNFRSPYATNFQLTLERELPSRTIARLSYVGSLGRHNQNTYEGNPITQAGHDACLASASCGSKTTTGYRNLQSYYYSSHTQYGFVDPVTGIPAFPSIGEVTTESSSNYNAFEASAHKVSSHGLDLQVSYTFSHSLDDSSSYENSGYGGSVRGYNQYVKSLNYGNSTFDARHRLVIAPIYIVPFKGRSPFSLYNLAAGGWQVSSITVLATGFPFDISYGGGSANSLYCSPSIQYYACPDEPNQSGPLTRVNPRVKIVSNGQTLNRTAWFTAATSGITQAPLGTFGNSGRDTFHGPGINNTNLVIAKNFNLGADGTIHMQIRMESDNVFNHTQFSNPGSTPSSTAAGITNANPTGLSLGSTGQITLAAAARLTQLAAKIYF